MTFSEFKNLAANSLRRVKNCYNEWNMCNYISVSVVKLHDKKLTTIVSSVYYGSEVPATNIIRSGKILEVIILRIVNN